MKPFQFLKQIQFFFRGSNRGRSQELLAAEEGFHIDACNMRGTTPGSTTAKTSIRGEELLHANIDNSCWNGTGLPFSDNYRNTGSCSVLGQKFEIWCDQDAVGPSYIRIDGVVVCKSENLPFVATHEQQIGVNENCLGGEVIVVDNLNPPFIFRIKDMLENGGVGDGASCSAKYFDDFNPAEHYLILQPAMNRFAFIGLTTSQSGDYVFLPDGTAGLNVGQYTYSYRWKTQQGDSTPWSVPTPKIPVAMSVLDNSDTFPGVKTRGGEPNIAVQTTYGIKLRLRVDNKLGYTAIQVRRTRWTAGDQFGVPPVTEICGEFAVTENQFQVIDVVDFGGFLETLGTDEITEVMAGVETAKSVTYFNKRAWLGNIKYASRKIEEGSYELVSTENAMCWVMEKLGKLGHSDPWNFCYKPNYLSGEKYGHAFVFYDGKSYFTFAEPIPGFENYEAPNRRDKVSGSEMGIFYDGAVVAADNDGVEEYTYEVFDLEDAVAKSDICKWHNISNNASQNLGNILAQVGGSGTCGVGNYDPYENWSGSTIVGDNLGFRPFTPAYDSDNNVDSHNWRPVLGVQNGGSYMEYNPRGFAPDYWSKGIAFKGLQSWPSWATGMSVVRTRPAKHVVSQGLAFYALKTAGGGLGENTSKHTNKIWLYCPDIDPDTGLYPEVIQQMLSNPTAYSIEAQSALGFFSEPYSFFDPLFGAHIGVDMMTYARVLREDFSGGDSDINPGESASMGIGDGSTKRYVGFGKWRSLAGAGGGVFQNEVNGTVYDGPIQITAINDQPTYRGRGKYLEVTLASDIFWYEFAGAINGDDSGVKDWHEPVYVVNIIREASINNDNTVIYEQTGHYQKFESIIGFGDDNQDQLIELIDERWEDCVNMLSYHQSTAITDLHRFVWVDNGNGQYVRWVCVSEWADPDIIAVLDDIVANGVATVSDASGDYQVYGVYTHEEGTEYRHQVKLKFGAIDGITGYNNQVWRPAQGRAIMVKYDNRIPMRVFGGDTVVGESIFAPLDIKYNANADPEQTFRLNVSFPHREWQLNPHQLIAKKIHNGGQIQDNMVLKLDNGIGLAPAKMRQLCVMFCVESRAVLNFAYHDTNRASNFSHYPLRHYIQRPYKWNDNGGFADQNIFPEYWDAYGEAEFDLWGYGGFRFRPLVNIDYSKSHDNNGQVITSVPSIGYYDQDRYCSRIIFSLERAINAMFAEGIQTFPDTNYYDLPDHNGGINFLEFVKSRYGDNIYALCESGVFMVLVDKQVLSQINGEDIGLIGMQGGIVKHLEISNMYGCPGENWRGVAKSHDAIFFPGKNSLFRIQNDVEDISEDYRPVINRFLSDVQPGFNSHIAGAFDPFYKEWLLHFDRKMYGAFEFVTQQTDETSPVFIVSQQQNDAIPAEFYEYGTTVEAASNTVVVLSANSVIQAGVYLGGSSGMLLQNQVIICCSESSQYAVTVFWKEYTDEGNTVLNGVSLQPGSCLMMIPEAQLISNGAYWNPWLDYSVYFTARPYNVKENIGNYTDCSTIVYYHPEPEKKLPNAYHGRYDYRFDKIYSSGEKMYGTRENETYLLDVGFSLNGQPIQAGVLQCASPDQDLDKEFARIRVMSDIRPTAIKFYDSIEDYDNGVVSATIIGSDLHDTNGYEQYIPLKAGKHFQGRRIFFEIVRTLESQKFGVNNTHVEYIHIQNNGRQQSG